VSLGLITNLLYTDWMQTFEACATEISFCSPSGWHEWPVSSFGKELASQLWGRSLFPLAGCSPEEGTYHSAHGPMLLLPAVAQKLRLHFVQLRAVSRCCIMFACQHLTMPRLLWFMCHHCVRLSTINKACKLGGKPPYARRRCYCVTSVT